MATGHCLQCDTGDGDDDAGRLRQLRSRRSVAAPAVRTLARLPACVRAPGKFRRREQNRVRWWRGAQAGDEEASGGGGGLSARGPLGAQHRPAERGVVAVRGVVVPVPGFLVLPYQVQDGAQAHALWLLFPARFRRGHK